MEYHFDASRIPEAEEYEPLPEGWYDAVAKKAEWVPTKAGNGHFQKWTFVVGPEHRTLIARFNIDNPNQQAVEIAQRKLASFVRAAGKTAIRDTDELIGVHVRMRLTLEEAREGYRASNEVAAFAPAGGKAAAPNPPAEGPPARAAAPPTASRPAAPAPAQAPAAAPAPAYDFEDDDDPIPF